MEDTGPTQGTRKMDSLEPFEDPSAHKSDLRAEGIESKQTLGSGESEALEIASAGNEMIMRGNELVPELASDIGVDSETAEQVARDSGITERWGSLRSRIARATFAGFLALQVGAAEDGAHLQPTEGARIEQSVAIERPKTMGELVERFHGKNPPPEILSAYKDIRYWQMHDPLEHSVMIYKTPAGYEFATDEVGGNNSTPHFTDERLERMYTEQVREVIDIHTHPLQPYTTLFDTASNTLARASRGEHVPEEAQRIANMLTETPREEYARQEQMIRAGTLDAPINWPSDHDVWLTMLRKDSLGEHGKDSRSLVADGSGLWEISVRQHTPFGDAAMIARAESTEARAGLKKLTEELRAGTITPDEYEKHAGEFRDKGGIPAQVEDALLHHLSRCGWELKAPYSKEAVDRAEMGDVTLAKKEYVKRSQLMDLCRSKLSKQGLDLIHHPWPEEKQ